MSSAVEEVGVTYLYRGAGSLIVWVLGVGSVVGPLFILMLVRPQTPGLGPTLTAAAAAWFSAVFSGLVGFHVREQFAVGAARVVPGYRVVHVGVAAVLAALVAVVVPLGMGWWCGVWPVGTLAVSACAAGPVWWFAVTRSPWFMVPMVVAPGLLFNRHVGDVVAWVAGGVDPRWGVGIALGGVGAIAAALWRAATLHEGVAAYQRVVGGKGWGERGGRSAMRSVEREVARAEGAGGGFWSRSRRWGASFAWVSPTWGGLAPVAAAYLFRAFAGHPTPLGPSDAMLWMTFMTTVFAQHPLGRRRDKPSLEMMRPVGRHAFFAEAGALLLLRNFRLWGTLMLASVVAAWATTPSGAMEVTAWVKVIVVSFGSQLLFAGILLNSLRHSEGRRAVETMIGIVLVIGTSMTLADRAGLPVACAAGGCMSAVGVGIVAYAYGAWLVTDLE